MIKKEVPGLNRTIHATNNWLSEIADEIGPEDAQIAYHRCAARCSPHATVSPSRRRWIWPPNCRR